MKLIGEGGIGDDERSASEGALELDHDLLMMVRLHQFHSFLEEVGERCTYLSMILGKTSVVVG